MFSDTGNMIVRGRWSERVNHVLRHQNMIAQSRWSERELCSQTDARKSSMAVRPKMRRRRRTKIIATLGPASSSMEILTRLFQAGADVFRLNFSHGSHEDHAVRFAMIRDLEKQFDRPIGILADVQGPKLRVGRFSGGRVHLQTGQTFRLD